MQGDYFYLKTPDEMAEAYRDIPDALENTHKIAEMCDLKLILNACTAGNQTAAG